MTTPVTSRSSLPQNPYSDELCGWGKIIFPLPFRFLAGVPHDKRLIWEKQNFNNMYTSYIHGRCPGKLDNSLKGPNHRLKLHFQLKIKRRRCLEGESSVFRWNLVNESMVVIQNLSPYFSIDEFLQILSFFYFKYRQRDTFTNEAFPYNCKSILQKGNF